MCPFRHTPRDGSSIIKTLIHSNAAWTGTGYGTQTQQLGRHLIADGHPTAVSCFYGLAGTILQWDGFTLYPAGYDAYGNDILIPHANHWFGGQRNGLVVTLVDAWVLHPDVLRQLYVAAWTPVDHDPIPPKVLEVLQRSGCWPVAMSRFGERAMREAGLDPFYAPHGIDTEMFRPRDRAETRQELGLPDSAFIVLMVAANKGYPSRKCFSHALEAFAELARHHSDATLYLHTEPNGTIGHPIAAQLTAAGIDPKRVHVSDPYMQTVGAPAEYVAKLYAAADVLLNPAMGEGFGVPIVESQACGTPVIVSDWTAMRELCGAGWALDGDRVFTDQRSYMMMPHVGEILYGLEQAYEEAEGLRDMARSFALQYDADRVYEEHWQPILAELAGRIEPLALPDMDAEVELVAA